jgi:putative DNA primase/helicase
MAAVGIPTPPAKAKPTSNGFLRWGKNNRYWLKQLDGVVLFGDFNTGESHQWFEDDDKPLDAEQVAARRAKMLALRKEMDEEQQQQHEQTAISALNQWNGLAENGASPYIVKKQVEAFCLRFDEDAVTVPMRDANGKLWSLQTIKADGSKRFLYNGRKKGCFHTIGDIGTRVIIAEGYSTGASIYMAMGIPVVVAFDAGNLDTVIEALTTKHHGLEIIIAGDDDCWKTPNTGRVKAEAAAQKYGCKVVFPTFKNNSTKPTDFNDLHCLEGLDVVKAQLLAAPDPETTPDDLALVVARLAALPTLDYEKVREAEAERLGVRVSALDKEVEAVRKGKQSDSGGITMFPTVELWPHPVDGALLLHELVKTIRQFIICNKETATATALWCAFTWVVDSVQVAPLAVITAPEKRCGKSQLLNLIGKLACRPLVASNISPSATFRVIEAYHPTLLIDEADTFFKDNEELRGVINSGHTRQSAYVIRNVGDNHEPTQFSTWGAKAISGIGALSDTLMDRAIILTLRRKLSGETVQRLRHADAGLFETLASKLARFADDNGAKIALARPVLPDALNDRAQDNWEPLLAIADCVGGGWPKIARDAALILSGAEQESVSLSAELLADIREVFDSKKVSHFSSADLIKELCEDDEKSWATYNRGQPIKPRQLAKRLAEYGIASKTIRVSSYSTPKGYELSQFEDAFTRYLSPATSATAPQSSTSNAYGVADSGERCETNWQSATEKPAFTLDCGGVADIMPPTADNKMVEVTL